MASLPATEHEYDFVEKPSEDFYCPVTLDLLREPFLTACCGNHLSQDAVTRLQGQPCPVCKESSLSTVPDKYFKRKVNEFKVRCPNKSLGCEWVGELGSLDRHLSQNSVEGGCQFVTMACPHSCGNSFLRCRLQGHKANDCPNRPFACQYCDHKATYITVTNDHWPICAKYPVDCPNKSLGCQWAGERCLLEWHKANDCPNRPFTCQYCDHKATYIEITNEHWPICKQYPLECPNDCGENAIKRQHLLKHLVNTCPLQVTKCEFSYAGCEVECQRQHMQTHLEENVKVHLNKVSCRTKQQESQIKALRLRTEQQQRQINSLVAALRPLTNVFGHSTVMVMTNFEKHKTADDEWFSPPFYSHIGGYKVCLAVFANGNNDGKDTHVSVYCTMFQGAREYDDQLKWPFRGDITIQLLNQSRDEDHWEITIPFDDRAGDDVAGRVIGKKRGTSGWGQPKFIAHAELNTENKEYLKNDCLKFRISKFVVGSI